MRTMMGKMERVYGCLQDEESKKLFNIRLAYSINRNTADYFASIGSMYSDWYSPQLEEGLATL